MKKLFVSIILLVLILAGCGQAPPEAAIPTSLPEPTCRGNVCIQQVFLWISENTIAVEFDLTDRDGTVKVGAEPSFTGELTMALFLEDGDKDSYLIGAKVSSSHYICYSGNDIPWSWGKLASSCSIPLLLTQLQVRPQVGDTIRVELLEFDLVRSVNLERK